jgi:beta-aspartyl-peptidase (threonine type)
MLFSFSMFWQIKYKNKLTVLIYRSLHMTYSLIIHGGAGGGTKQLFKKLAEYNPLLFHDLENRFHYCLKECVSLGEKMLQNNCSASDVVLKCIEYMENCELFNAGKGAVLDRKNKVSLDASMMEGKNGGWGGVMNTNVLKNPSSLCYKLMNSRSGLITGNENILELAKQYNLEIIKDPNYFITKFRTEMALHSKDNGTVGVVCRDNEGLIVAGTSTGGRQNKQSGRVGDSPIIGIGSYANNLCCGLSLTGHGEDIISHHGAIQIYYRMKFNNQDMKTAIDETINTITKGCGIIGINKDGSIYYNFNTKRMYVGFVTSGQKIKTSIWDKKC